MPLYLADSSIWIGAQRRPQTYLTTLLSERIAADEIATCIPIALEVLVGPATGAELDQDWQSVWAHLRWLSLGEPELQRALELLRGLSRTTSGAHRRRPIDYVVAACAEAAGADVVLWHWDRDLSAICEHAGIAHEAEHERAKANGLGAEPGRRARPAG